VATRKSGAALLTTEQSKAIARFAQENNARLALSAPPFIKINFQDKDTGEIFSKELSELVYDHAVKALDEKKSAASEKRRKENDDKWKPRIA